MMKFNNLRELIRCCAQTTTQFNNAVVDEDHNQIWRALSKMHQIQKYMRSEHFTEIYNLDSANRLTFKSELNMLKLTQNCGKKYLQNKIIYNEIRIRKWG